MADILVVGGVSFEPQNTPTRARPGGREIQNILGTLKLVDDQGVASDIGGGATASPDYSVILAAPSQSLEITSLLGELEGGYLVRGFLIANAVTSNSWQFRLNQSTANLTSNGGDLVVGSQRNQADWMIRNTGPYAFAGGTTWSFTGELWVRSGKVRQFKIPAYTGITSDANHDSFWISGECTDPTTPVTGFGLFGGVANAFAAGSKLYLTPINNDKG